MDTTEYGPLNALLGRWQGDCGIDKAPEADGVEVNPYYEIITYTEAGGVTNADKQDLVAVHYRQQVYRKSNDRVIHDQTGYWIWNASDKIVMHSFTIPRGVGVLAGGICDDQMASRGELTLRIDASVADGDWSISQSPFMQTTARTTAFEQQLVIVPGKLSYSQATTIEIYGAVFNHTDENTLVRY